MPAEQNAEDKLKRLLKHDAGNARRGSAAATAGPAGLSAGSEGGRRAELSMRRHRR